MIDKVRLVVLGVTYNRIGSNVYGLILAEVDGPRHLPIVIGAPEAQSIQCHIQDIIPARPLTHDLMASILNIFGLKLLEVDIRCLPDGIFAADLKMTDGEREITIDARSSDAVALAIRLNAPIFTSREIMENSGYIPSERENTIPRPEEADDEELPTLDLDDLDAETRLRIITDAVEVINDDTLLRFLDDAVAREDYKEAGIIKREIDRRKSADRTDAD